MTHKLVHSADEPKDETPQPKHKDYDIEVILEGGLVTGVFSNGVEVRAMVRNYDVEFPVPAGQTDEDDNGVIFMPMIV